MVKTKLNSFCFRSTYWSKSKEKRGFLNSFASLYATGLYRRFASVIAKSLVASNRTNNTIVTSIFLFCLVAKHSVVLLVLSKHSFRHEASYFCLLKVRQYNTWTGIRGSTDLSKRRFPLIRFGQRILVPDIAFFRSITLKLNTNVCVYSPE
jgi:hypothetical protein